MLLLSALVLPSGAAMREARIGDVTHIEGVRDNALIGYGLVVGLNGTGDRRQSLVSVQSLAATLKKMGVQVPAIGAMTVSNIAAVFVTASLPPFARPGQRIDVTVSSTGDARSLEGGTLLLTPLYAPDGQVYAAAQGPLVVGGYAVAVAGAAKQANHPTVGRIPEGASVERSAVVDLASVSELHLVLSEPDFGTAGRVAEAINRGLQAPVAAVLDSRTVSLHPRSAAGKSVPSLLAAIEEIRVPVSGRAKIVVDERTGTVVMGSDITLLPVAIMHGGFAIEVKTDYLVSQPSPFSQGGETAVVPQTTLQAGDKPANRIELRDGATVEDLVRGLQSIGASARDVISILQALRAAGGLQAEIEVL
jgi:flagellar P-ring protein FlgI